MAIQAAIFTIGDRYVAGGIHDESGDILNTICLKMGWEVVERHVLGDAEQDIIDRLVQLVDSGKVDVIFTLDGIGVHAKDRVPEAMYQICEKWVPGLAEIIRVKCYENSAAVAATRGLAGVRAKTLLVNLPRNPTAVKDAMDALKPVLRHGIVEQLKEPSV
jgi:molybdopterin adenylyltransferase